MARLSLSLPEREGSPLLFPQDRPISQGWVTSPSCSALLQCNGGSALGIGRVPLGSTTNVPILINDSLPWRVGLGDQ